MKHDQRGYSKHWALIPIHFHLQKVNMKAIPRSMCSLSPILRQQFAESCTRFLPIKTICGILRDVRMARGIAVRRQLIDNTGRLANSFLLMTRRKNHIGVLYLDVIFMQIKTSQSMHMQLFVCKYDARQI